MADFWADWIEAVRFGCEAQGVISARLMLFASGAPDAVAEAGRMVAEKVAAFSDAQCAAEHALADGLGFMRPRSAPISRCNAQCTPTARDFRRAR